MACSARRHTASVSPFARTGIGQIDIAARAGKTVASYDSGSWMRHRLGVTTQ
jgi:hypothetical protein